MTHPAMVLIARPDPQWPSIRIGDDGATFQVPAGALRPMPDGLPEREQAVLDAALQYATHRDKHGPYSYEAGISLGRLLLSVDALRESLAPVDPVAEVNAAWQELLRNKSFQHDAVGRMADAVAALEAKS